MIINKFDLIEAICIILHKAKLYRGADKPLARTDISYVKIKHISCLSSL